MVSVRVLKRREARLKREQDGLRGLVCRFPGGEAALREWEAQWTHKFGGAERDEIDHQSADPDDASDDDDPAGDADDDGSERAHARKRPKLDAAAHKERRRLAPALSPPSAVPAPSSGAAVVPEKRKRGRPRKVQPQVPRPVDTTGPTPRHATTATVQPQQYLLAVFALFSFLNSPLTSSTGGRPHHHAPTGTVLSHVSHATDGAGDHAMAVSGWGWHEAMHALHLLAAMLILASIVLPWLPFSFTRRLPTSRLRPLSVAGETDSKLRGASADPLRRLLTWSAANESGALPTPPVSPDASDDGDSDGDSSSTEDTVRASPSTKEGWRWDPSPPLVRAALEARGTSGERDMLLAALRDQASTASCLVACLHGAVGFCVPTSVLSRAVGHAERQAWLRLAELAVLRPCLDKTVDISLALRLRAYDVLARDVHDTSRRTSNAVSELCTLALLVRELPLPFARARAETLWMCARRVLDPDTGRMRAAGVDEGVGMVEELVGRMELEDAVAWLSTATTAAAARTRLGAMTPIQVLALMVLRRRLHRHAAILFVHRVVRAVAHSNSDVGLGVDLDLDLDSIAMDPSSDMRAKLGFRFTDDEAARLRDTIDLGCGLGGDAARLCRVLARVWRDEDVEVDMSVEDLLRGTGGVAADYDDDEDVRVLLAATMLHGRVFRRGDRAERDAVLRLRRVLGAPVFEEQRECFRRPGGTEDDPDGEEWMLEDARDCVVDRLVELERATRTAAGQSI